MGLKELRAKDVMLKDFFSLSPEETVAGAKLKMARLGVGGAPVVDAERNLLGLITYRDMDLSGKPGSRLSVKDLMTKKVVSVEEGAFMMEIVTIMREKGYQRIPVVRNRKVVGFVTQSCIINAISDHI